MGCLTVWLLRVDRNARTCTGAWGGCVCALFASCTAACGGFPCKQVRGRVLGFSGNDRERVHGWCLGVQGRGQVLISAKGCISVAPATVPPLPPPLCRGQVPCNAGLGRAGGGSSSAALMGLGAAARAVSRRRGAKIGGAAHARAEACAIDGTRLGLGCCWGLVASAPKVHGCPQKGRPGALGLLAAGVLLGRGGLLGLEGRQLIPLLDRACRTCSCVCGGRRE